MKSIKKYITESLNRFSCVKSFIGLYSDLQTKEYIVSNIHSLIDYDDLTEDSLEIDPHVSIIYGLSNDFIIDDAIKAINPFELKSLRLNPVTACIFDNEDSDVLVIKFDQENTMMPLLNARNKMHELANVKETYSIYKPHLTIGYFKKGLAEKYIDVINLQLKNKAFSFSRVIIEKELNGGSTETYEI